MTTTERLWTIEDVAEYLGISINTLYYWRTKGKGPTARRLGKYVRYRPEDVRSWVSDQEPR